MVAAVRLAKYLAHSGVASRRASEQLVFAGRVTVGGEVVRDPARDVDGSDPGRRRRPQRARLERPARGLRGPQAARRGLHGARPAGPPDDRLARPERPAPVPGRPPRRRHDRPDPAHRRRRARPPAHASVVRGPAHLPRQGPPRRRCARRRCSGCARGSSSRTARPRPRASSGSRADRIELTIHEGRKRQVRRMCEAVGHPVIALERVRFGPLWLGKLEEGQHRRLTAPEIEKLRRACSIGCCRHAADRPPRRHDRRRQRGRADPARHRGADARAARAQPPRRGTRSSAASSR